MDERRERVEDRDPDVATLEPDRVGDRVAVDPRPDDRRVDEPDVDALAGRSPRSPTRSASRIAWRWTPSISLPSSLSVIGRSALIRCWSWTVVKPLTSSPAMPMTTCSAGSRPSPRLPGARPSSCRRRPRCRPRCPTACAPGPGASARRPRTTPLPPSISKTSAFANSVPTSSAVHAVRRRSRRGCQSGARTAIGRSDLAIAAARADGVERRRRRPRASCRGPGPSRAGRRPCRRSRRTATLTRSPARDALRARGRRDGHEQLRLVAVEGDRDHVRAQRGAEVLRVRLHRIGGLERRGERDDRHAVERLPLARRDRRASAGRAPPPSLSLRRASRSSSWSAAIRSGTASIDVAPTVSAARSRRSRRARRCDRHPRPSGPRCAGCPSRCSARR